MIAHFNDLIIVCRKSIGKNDMIIDMIMVKFLKQYIKQHIHIYQKKVY